MPKLTMDVWPKEGCTVTAAEWEQFMLRVLDVTNDMAGDFPMLTISVPVIKKGKRG